MNIRINIRNIERWIAFLKTVPRGAKGIATRAFAEYVLGTEDRGLRHYPGYKYVTRRRAYGYTFKSDKQRKWFWAKGGPNMIGNHRTGAIGNGWQVSSGNNGGYTITNNVPGVGWLMGTQQANQPQLVGWKTAWEIVRENMADGIAAAKAATMSWLGSK